MKRWQAKLPAGLALASLGAINVVCAVANTQTSGTTCAPHMGLVASLGTQLQMLATSSLCPDHTYLPGPNLQPALQLWLMVSVSMVATGVACVLAAVGFRYWLHKTLQSARAWLSARFGITLNTLVPTPRTVPESPSDNAKLRFCYFQPLRRRGPPVSLV